MFYNEYLRHEDLSEKSLVDTLRKREDKLIRQFANELYKMHCEGTLRNIDKNVSNELTLPLPRSQKKIENGKKGEKIIQIQYFENANFWGRSAYLKDIYRKFAIVDSEKPIIQIIYGLEGVGKTQLVLKYAYEKINEYKTICWIDCINEDALMRSCHDFLVKANEQVATNVIKSRFCQWFQSNNNWLLVFDDVFDIDNIENLIPKIGQGHIIIITRKMQETGFELKCMESSEAVGFLTKRSNISDEENAEKIAVRLGCFPLALEQAAVYIKNTGINFTQFLVLLKKYELEPFKEEFSFNIPKRTIHNVWSVVINSLSNGAKHLLYCFAYLSSNRIEPSWMRIHAMKLKAEQEEPELFIPERKKGILTDNQINVSEIFRKYDEKSYFFPELIEIFANDLTLNKSLSELKNYSLIATKTDYTFTMHVLLQEVVRARINNPSYLLAVWEVIKTMCHYSDIVYDDYRIGISLSQAESLIQNIYAILEYRNELKSAYDNEKSNVLDIDILLLEYQLYSFFAQYLTLRGDTDTDKSIYEKADKYYSGSCKLAVSLFGGGDNDTITNTESFRTIQEKHRRMRLNLLLRRDDVAMRIYNGVNEVLTNSKTVNPSRVSKALDNYSNLYDEFHLKRYLTGVLID